MIRLFFFRFVFITSYHAYDISHGCWPRGGHIHMAHNKSDEGESAQGVRYGNDRQGEEGGEPKIGPLVIEIIKEPCAYLEGEQEA